MRLDVIYFSGYSKKQAKCLLHFFFEKFYKNRKLIFTQNWRTKLRTMPTSARKCFFRTRANTTSAAVDGRLGLFTNFGRVGSQLINHEVSVICHGFVMGSDQNLANICSNSRWRPFFVFTCFLEKHCYIQTYTHRFLRDGSTECHAFARNPQSFLGLFFIAIID